MGDFNINMKHKTNSGYHLLTDFCRDYVFLQVIKHQTSITQKTLPLIDLVITNIELYFRCVHNTVISDSLPVSIRVLKRKIRRLRNTQRSNVDQ